MDTAGLAYRLQKRDYRTLGIAVLGMVLWNLVTWRFPFLWDTVLNSRIAHWYLETGFSSIPVPEELDAGHPPFFSLYLALVWRITGPALWAAHLAMLPFLLLLVHQFWKLSLRFLPSGLRGAAMVLLFCEPTFLAQSSMITPDIVLVSLFLTAVNAILDGRRWLLGVVLVGMAAATFRGILAVPAVFLIDLGLGWMQGLRKPQWRRIGPYLPVALLTGIWLWVHYRAVGWLLTPPPETYGAHRKLVGPGEMLRNLGIVGWRFLDFGRVAVWTVILAGLVLAGKRVWRKEEGFRRSLLLFLAPAVVYTLLFIPFSNPIGMRYFLVCYLLLLLPAVLLTGELSPPGRRKWWFTGMGLVLLSGHFWVYPDHIAKSWDSSLAHVPYFFMEEEPEYVVRWEKWTDKTLCTDFPMLARRQFTHPGASGGLHWQDKKEMESLLDCDCVWWSNISNGFEEADMQILRDESLFRPKLSVESIQVRMIVYGRVDPDTP